MKKKIIALLLLSSVIVSCPIIGYASEPKAESNADNSTVIFDTDSKKLTFDQFAILPNDLGQPTIIVFFDYINKTTLSKSPTTEFIISATQNGNPLMTAIVSNPELSSYYSNQFVLTNTDDPITFYSAFVLSDTSEVELKISDSLTGKNVQTITLSLDEAIAANEKDEQEEKEKSIEESYGNIDKFIEQYNSLTEDPITDIQNMDIQGLDRRIEYRLNSFNNAVGKKGTLSNSTIEIVNYGYPINDCLRIYFDTSSYDTVIDTCTKIIHMFDKTASEQEINKIYDTLNSIGSCNIILDKISGYINTKHSNGEISGYNLMLDYSDLSFDDASNESLN